MAFEAGVVARHPGEGLGFKETMACVTLQSLFYMLFVIERDGLISLRAKAKVDEKEEQSNSDN